MAQAQAQAELTQDGGRVELTWPDGARRAFAARWLFDHADDARDPVSGQRGHAGAALAGAIRLDAAEIEGEALTLRFSPSAVQRRIALARLRESAAPAAPMALWLEPSAIEAATPIDFHAFLTEDEALREALSRVARRGLAILTGAGLDPAAVEEAVARFGFVRETNYGRCFDVRIHPQPGNLAYTERALDLHADNPYRDPVPSLQLLHAITADADGGETLFVDGFAHAEALRQAALEAFDRLARTPVRFTFTAEGGARWSNTAPVLSLGADGAVQTVRLNHRSLDIAPGGDPAEVEAWYEAYLAFYERVHAPGAAYERRFAPGEMVIFDNRRMLHARRALTSTSPRWLRGCYADVDGLNATLARLERTAAPGA